MCAKGFPSDKKVDVHCEEHGVPEKCLICYRIFASAALVDIHIAQEHSPKREENDIEIDEQVIQLISFFLNFLLLLHCHHTF